jgi:hypothetical protein
MSRKTGFILISLPLAILLTLLIFSIAVAGEKATTPADPASPDCYTKITIIKDSEPPNGQNFSFTAGRSGGGWGGNFSLSDLDTSLFPVDVDGIAAPSSKVYNTIDFNKWYTFTENITPAEWQLKKIVCSVTDTSGNPKNDVPINITIAPAKNTGSVAIYLKDYRYVTCTFTNADPLDYGDLPEGGPLPFNMTTFANDGARHYIPESNIYLGTAPDVEADGWADPNARGDDTHGVADEDGVVRDPAPWGSGTGKVSVTVNGPQGSAGCLMGWLDYFNAAGNSLEPDGIFQSSFTYNSNPYSEIIINNQYVTPGIKDFSFSLPVDAASGVFLYARFRIVPYNGGGYNEQTGTCNQAPVGLKGLAIGGEVEDYGWLFGPSAVTLQGFSAETASTSLTIVLIVLVLGIATLTVLWRILSKAQG